VIEEALNNLSSKHGVKVSKTGNYQAVPKMATSVPTFAIFELNPTTDFIVTFIKGSVFLPSLDTFEFHFVVAQKSHKIANFGNFKLPEVAGVGNYRHCNCFQKLPKLETFLCKKLPKLANFLGSPLVSKIGFVTYLTDLHVQ